MNPSFALARRNSWYFTSLFNSRLMDAQRVRAPNERVAKYYADAELESIAKTLIIPTSDDEVRHKLRSIGEPAELNHEDRANRRLRLRKILAHRKSQGIVDPEESEESETFDDSGVVEESWIEGLPGLKEARKRIAAYAEPKTAVRLQKEQQKWLEFENNRPLFTNSELARRRYENEQQKKSALVGTQSGFSRAVGSVAYNGNFVVAGDWSGSLSVLDMHSDMSVVARASPHSNNSSAAAQTCVDWLSCIASGSSDGTVLLHDFVDNVLETRATMQGHEDRISSVTFHPSESYLFSASHDRTWRLWDLESATCVLKQLGHSKAIKTISPHEDGALVLSAGDDAVGHVTDLRSGKRVALLHGCAQSVHASAWNVNKAVLGGADNQCIVWDLRHATRPIVEIPAHNDLVTDISINGNIMATSSMDGTMRLWSCDTWRLQRTLHVPTRLLAVTAIENGWVAARWDRCIDWYTYNEKMIV